jgi:putative membrane protein
MRNVIVFINICIVAAVSLMVVDFETSPNAPARASMQSPGPEKPNGNRSNASAGTSLAALKERRSAPVTSLSKNEMMYVKEFITEMRQVRIFDREQGKLAAQRGTSRSLKDYGSWMVLNQQQMLDDLNKLAARYGVDTNVTLDGDLTAGLSELNDLHGKKFDARYMKTTISTHKDDLRRLERASYSRVADIQVFATRYMSLTRDNFSKLQEIRRSH